MDLTILLTGLLVVALFILPFYYVVRTSKNNEKHDAIKEKETSASPLGKKNHAH